MYVYQVDPSTGESEEEGYEDEYQLEDSEVQIFCACNRLNGKKILVLRLYLEMICLLKCTVMFLIAGYSRRLHTEDWSVKL
jgi:hypothetical protein